MGDVLILKTTHHLHNGRAFPDGSQKLVAQALALAGAAHQTGDVDEIHAGMNGLLRFRLGRERVHALVRHGHSGLVGLNGAEGIIGGLGVLCFGQGVEQGGLAHVGQAHDADAERHGDSLRCAGAYRHTRKPRFRTGRRRGLYSRKARRRQAEPNEMSRCTCRFGVKITAKYAVFAVVTPPVAARNPLRLCGGCCLTRH